MIRLLFPLLGHLMVTLARLARPGGVRAVVAESLAVKHQLLIMQRSQRRAPNLSWWDRLMLGFYTLLVSPKRIGKLAVIPKASTLVRFHRALVKRKYHLLYGSQRARRPRPKGPSRELIAAVVEMKRRNPRMGCRKIAEQISNTFGLAINKDVVRRILILDYRPAPGGVGPSWLSVIGQARDSLWSVDLFRCESILLQSYWVMVVMDIFTRRIIGFGVAAANEYSQVRSPTMKAEQRIVVRRKIFRQRLPRDCTVEHPADPNASRLAAATPKPMIHRVYTSHHHHPAATQQN
jgi:putative transposase